MSSLQLNVLGRFESRLPSGAVLSLPTRKAEALLAYLCLEPGIPHSRDRLSNLLWSDRSEEQARNSMWQCLSAIGKSLGDVAERILNIDRMAITLNSV